MIERQKDAQPRASWEGRSDMEENISDIIAVTRRDWAARLQVTVPERFVLQGVLFARRDDTAYGTVRLPVRVLYKKRWPRNQATAAMNAEHGMVSTHAQTMLPATPQRTALSLLTEPTPTMAPVIV